MQANVQNRQDSRGSSGNIINYFASGPMFLQNFESFVTFYFILLVEKSCLTSAQSTCTCVVWDDSSICTELLRHPATTSINMYHVLLIDFNPFCEVAIIGLFLTLHDCIAVLLQSYYNLPYDRGRHYSIQCCNTSVCTMAFSLVITSSNNKQRLFCVSRLTNTHYSSAVCTLHSYLSGLQKWVLKNNLGFHVFLLTKRYTTVVSLAMNRTAELGTLKIGLPLTPII